jgi:hypothetical protein
MARRNWLFGSRAVETTPKDLAVSGAASGWGVDPVDGDRGYVRADGGGPREVPSYTLEYARTLSIHAYRTNPMARAIVDTYTSFAVGDSGVTLQCTDPLVRPVVDRWWNDPRNQLVDLQPMLCRDWMLQGELVWEFLVGSISGVVRYSPIDPARIRRVNLDRGNPLWHKSLEISGLDSPLDIVALDDETELRTGQVAFFPSWRALITDRRGTPFLGPVLDDLEAYGQVLSNLVDRTAIARYLAFDVEVQGGQTEVDEFVKNRGGRHLPPSGSIEVHNQGVKWSKMEVSTGSFEDTNTSGAILTNVAGGTGLAKTWLAESEGANRATSLSMAEPVRRRVGGLQGEWLRIMTENTRFAVDQAVAVGRLPKLIETVDGTGEEMISVPPSQLVRVVGPEIAAADAQVTAQTMLNLSTGLEKFVKAGIMAPEAAAIAAAKAWEQFVGTPMPKGLKLSPASADDIAEEIDKAQPAPPAAEAFVRRSDETERQADRDAEDRRLRQLVEAFGAAQVERSAGPEVHFHLPESVEVQMTRQEPIVIPAPVVPAPIIHVAPAEVTVNVEPTPVEVNVVVPEQPAPVVYVAPAEVSVPAPVVTVVEGDQGAKSVKFTRDSRGLIVGAEVTD